MTLSVSGAPVSSSSIDDAVTVTHFSLDSWGKIEQKTTPFSPKVTNHSQNPFNPFTGNANNDAESTNNNTEESSPDEGKETEEKKVNTNPFIDSNPFLGLLNPFKEMSPPRKQSVIEEHNDIEMESSGARVVKTEEIQTTTTTLTHKVSSLLCTNVRRFVCLRVFRLDFSMFMLSVFRL